MSRTPMMLAMLALVLMALPAFAGNKGGSIRREVRPVSVMQSKGAVAVAAPSIAYDSCYACDVCDPCCDPCAVYGCPPLLPAIVHGLDCLLRSVFCCDPCAGPRLGRGTWAMGLGYPAPCPCGGGVMTGCYKGYDPGCDGQFVPPGAPNPFEDDPLEPISTGSSARARAGSARSMPGNVTRRSVRPQTSRVSVSSPGAPGRLSVLQTSAATRPATSGTARAATRPATSGTARVADQPTTTVRRASASTTGATVPRNPLRD